MENNSHPINLANESQKIEHYIFARKLPIFILLSYLILLLLSYRFEYFVPDFKAYSDFGKADLPAKDGFSTLFLDISALATKLEWPGTLILFSAISMALGMAGFLFYFHGLEGSSERRLGILLCSSSGIWYYIYGKSFYDFPLTIGTLGLILLLKVKIRNQAKSSTKLLIDYLCYFLLGIASAWKPYNFFSTLGFILLFNKENLFDDSKENITIFHRKYFGFFIALIAGAISCNYRIVFEPFETLSGLRAYSASSDFERFLYQPITGIWDHISSVGFFAGVYNEYLTISILFIIPSILRLYKLLAINSFIASFFYLFITNLSPGFVWHGFTFGIYILCVLNIILCYIDRSSILAATFTRLTLYSGLGIQITSMIFSYIPSQIAWGRYTDDSVSIIYTNGSSILKFISDRTEDIDGSFKVITDLERLSYVVRPNDNSFLPVLQGSNPEGWKQFLNNQRYKENNPDYIFRISPIPLLNLGQVLRTKDLDLKEYKLITLDFFNGYAVYFYHRTVTQGKIDIRTNNSSGQLSVTSLSSSCTPLISGNDIVTIHYTFDVDGPIHIKVQSPIGKEDPKLFTTQSSTGEITTGPWVGLGAMFFFIEASSSNIMNELSINGCN